MNGTGFSLTASGLFDRLLGGKRFVRADSSRLERRAVVAALVAWVPLAAMALLLRDGAEGAAIGFFQDIVTHVRFLVVLPLLIYAERIIGQRTKIVADTFLTSGLIGDEDVSRFQSAVSKVKRLLDSIFVELILLVFAYSIFWFGFRARTGETNNWFDAGLGGERLTAAGWWYVVVTPLVGFLFLRWLWRYGVWAWFLHRLARLDLRLVGTHPDRAGGLGFVKIGHAAFTVIFFAASCAVAAGIANEIFHLGASLRSFQTALIAYGVLGMGVALAPLLLFSRPLIKAKRKWRIEYSRMATRYVQTFERKWLGADTGDDEELKISSDLQGLADLGGGMDRLTEMSRYFLDLKTAAAFAMALAFPLVPLVLTVVPAREILMLLVKVVA